MRARWQSLYRAFERTVHNHHHVAEFASATRSDPILARFRDPQAIVDWLLAKRGDLDEKDRLLGALVAMVQRGKAREMATALLWLGLWPGLDRAYCRRLSFFGSNPEELVSAMGAAFTALVDSCDLTRVQRVAATLVRSTERAVLEHMRSEGEDAAVVVPSSGEEIDDELPAHHPCASLPGGGSSPHELVALRAWLAEVAGDDADLLMRVVIWGDTQREASEALGISHAAARKRLERALARIRERFAFQSGVMRASR